MARESLATGAMLYPAVEPRTANSPQCNSVAPFTPAGQNADSGVERDAIDTSLQRVISIGREQLTTGHIPQIDHIVPASAGQNAAVWIKGDDKDLVLVPFQRAQTRTGLGIPQPNRPIRRW